MKEQYIGLLPNFDANNLNISSNPGPTVYDVVQKYASYTMTPNNWYSVKTRMINGMIYLKIWPKDQQEPAEWTHANPIGGAVTSNEDASFNFELTNLDSSNVVTVKLDNVVIKTWELFPSSMVFLFLCGEKQKLHLKI